MKRNSQEVIELNADDFAKGVNNAIRALRAIYSGVRTMLDELTAELREPPEQLYRLPVPVKSVVKKESPDEKFLRSWFGQFYTFERVDDDRVADDDATDDDEDSDDGPGAKKPIRLSAGHALTFVKVVLFQDQEHSGKVQTQPPHLLYGMLRDCRVASMAKGQTLLVNRMHFRRILDGIHYNTPPQDELRTRAVAMSDKPVPKREKRANSVIFTLDEPPVLHRLFDIRGREDVREIAEHMKRLRARAKPQTRSAR